MKHISMHIKALTAAFLLCATTLPADEVTVSAPDSPTLRFALAELEKTLVHWKRLAEVTEKFNQLPVASNWRHPSPGPCSSRTSKKTLNWQRRRSLPPIQPDKQFLAKHELPLPQRR